MRSTSILDYVRTVHLFRRSPSRKSKKKKNPKEEKLLFVCYNLRASRGALTSIFFADLFWLARRTSPKRSDCSKIPSDPGHQVRDHWSNTWFTFRVQSCAIWYAIWDMRLGGDGRSKFSKHKMIRFDQYIPNNLSSGNSKKNIFIPRYKKLCYIN